MRDEWKWRERHAARRRELLAPLEGQKMTVTFQATMGEVDLEKPEKAD